MCKRLLRFEGTQLTPGGAAAPEGAGGLLFNAMNVAPEAEASEAAHPGAELAPEAGGGGAAASRPAPAVAPPQAAKPVNALSLFFSVLWDRIKRLFGGGRSA